MEKRAGSLGLSDKVRIGNTPWKALKEQAMRDNYKTQNWFVSNHCRWPDIRF